jgi:hypothetical protein
MMPVGRARSGHPWRESLILPQRPGAAAPRSPLVITIDATKVEAFARRLFAGVTAALTALVVLTGCGGSSSSPRTASTSSLSSSTPGATSTTLATSVAITAAARHCDPEPCQLTPADLAARLDDLCLRGNAAVKQADAGFEQATKARDYLRAAAAMESALREFPPYQLVIQGLTPPAQDRAAFTRYEDLTRRIHGLSKRIVSAGRARDTSELMRQSQLVREDLATRTRAAVDLGTKNCRL